MDQQETPERTEITYQLQVTIPDPTLPRKTQSSQCFSKHGPGSTTQASFDNGSSSWGWEGRCSFGIWSLGSYFTTIPGWGPGFSSIRDPLMDSCAKQGLRVSACRRGWGSLSVLLSLSLRSSNTVREALGKGNANGDLPNHPVTIERGTLADVGPVKRAVADTGQCSLGLLQNSPGTFCLRTETKLISCPWLKNAGIGHIFPCIY